VENFFVIEREREDLRMRIDARVDAMFEAGLVEETCSLRLALDANAVARQSSSVNLLFLALSQRSFPPAAWSTWLVV
jgi:tRNA A37 N6-isopentenylltransferase MiaA